MTDTPDLVSRKEALAALEGLKKSRREQPLADAIVSSILDGAIAEVAALPAIPLDEKIVDVDLNWLTKDGLLKAWSKVPRGLSVDETVMIRDEDGTVRHATVVEVGDTVTLLRILPRAALPVLETKKETE